MTLRSPGIATFMTTLRICLHSILQCICIDQYTGGQPGHIAVYNCVYHASPRCHLNNDHVLHEWRIFLLCLFGGALGCFSVHGCTLGAVHLVGPLLSNSSHVVANVLYLRFKNSIRGCSGDFSPAFSSYLICCWDRQEVQEGGRWTLMCSLMKKWLAY